MVNEPFSGTYVPLAHHTRDRRVSSIMIELRRDTYLSEQGALEASKASRVVAALANFLESAGTDVAEH